MTAELALTLIFLASVSQAIGTQSPILLANRVSRRTYSSNLLLSSAGIALAEMTWAAATCLLARFLLPVPPPIATLLLAFGIGNVPRLLSVLILIPYLGTALTRPLAWGRPLCVLVALWRLDGIPLREACACAVGGWLLVWLMRRAIGRPRATVQRRLRAKTAGAAAQFDCTDLPPTPGGRWAAPAMPGSAGYAGTPR